MEVLKQFLVTVMSQVTQDIANKCKKHAGTEEPFDALFVQRVMGKVERNCFGNILKKMLERFYRNSSVKMPFNLIFRPLPPNSLEIRMYLERFQTEPAERVVHDIFKRYNGSPLLIKKGEGDCFLKMKKDRTGVYSLYLSRYLSSPTLFSRFTELTTLVLNQENFGGDVSLQEFVAVLSLKIESFFFWLIEDKTKQSEVDICLRYQNFLKIERRLTQSEEGDIPVIPKVLDLLNSVESALIEAGPFAEWKIEKAGEKLSKLLSES